MAEPTQNYQNHARRTPFFQTAAVTILSLNFLYTIWQLWRVPGWTTAWQAVVAFGLVCLTFSARVMALTVQDRIIRLEMQLRLARVLPADLQGAIPTLRRNQFVALRFASDPELPVLVREIVEGRLQQPKDIKLRVKDWQADWLRA
jgi:hypothetical protein